MENSGKITKKELSRYFRSVGRALLCRQRDKRRILNDFKSSVELYIESHPEAGMSEISERFGTPKSIAEEFAADRGADYHRQLKRRRIITAVIIGILAAILVLTAVVSIMIIRQHHRSAAYYYDITISDYGITT